MKLPTMKINIFTRKNATVDSAIAGLNTALVNLEVVAEVQDAAATSKQEEANNLYKQAQAAREEAARARVIRRNLAALVC